MERRPLQQNDPTHSPLLTRRTAIAAGIGAALYGSLAGPLSAAEPDLTAKFRAIQTRIGGRLGIHVLDTHTGRRIGYDDTSRYAMASTFKLLLAAAVLAQADSGKIDLKRPIAIKESDMLSHAPVTSKHLAEGSMTVQALCAAVVQVSDNPAANLLLPLVGGPEGLTRFLRSIDDPITRLDRYELDLNTNLPNDPRDTTTPRAMVDSVQRLLTGKDLSAASRALLTQWLVESTTGLARIRKGLPGDWKVGDKTGTGSRGAVNNVAVGWPPQRKPVFIAVYMSESAQKTDELSAAHAEIGTLVAAEVLTSSER